MLTSNKSRLVSALLLILTFSLLICAMSVSVFAVDHDHDGDGVADHTAEEHENTAWENFVAWFDSTAGQVVGYVVCGLVLVAFVVFVILWIPKKEKKEKRIK